MTLEIILALALVSLLAIGSGISLGWVFHAKHAKMSPEGVGKVAQALALEAQAVRDAARETVARLEQQFAADRRALAGHAEHWQQHAARLEQQLRLATQDRFVAPATPPPNAAPAAAPVGENGASPALNEYEERVRNTLRHARVPEGVIDDLVAGRQPDGGVEQLPPILADAMMRDQTGAV